MKFQNEVVPLSKISVTSQYSNPIYLIKTKEEIRYFLDSIKQCRSCLNAAFLDYEKQFHLKGIFDRKFRTSFIKGFFSGRKEVEKQYDQFFLLTSKIYENYNDLFNFLTENRSKFQFINSRIICEIGDLREEYNRLAEGITLAQMHYFNYLEELNKE